ncbi:hypothetical protein C8J57DRAFT_1478201 [Mycena rebaudengoi]|nr:hypothetical protein C8J57DRAFT_1478201 [Mycena rebaudengoi]
MTPTYSYKSTHLKWAWTMLPLLGTTWNFYLLLSSTIENPSSAAGAAISDKNCEHLELSNQRVGLSVLVSQAWDVRPCKSDVAFGSPSVLPNWGSRLRKDTGSSIMAVTPHVLNEGPPQVRMHSRMPCRSQSISSLRSHGQNSINLDVTVKILAKCSGNWPCLACVAARKEDDCKFNDNSHLSSTRALIERTRELEKLLHQAKQMTPDFLDYQLDPGVLNELDQLGSASDPVALTIREDAEAVASSNEAGPSVLKPVSFDLLPVTLVHDTVGNPDLGVSLDVVPNLGVTMETEEEKLFRLSVLFLKSLSYLLPPLNLPRRRALFLQVAPQYGFSLSLKKLDAIAKGDMTGLVVHPVLVHVCHLWGYFLDFTKQNGTLVDFEIEELTHMRLIQGSLNGMFGPAPTPITSLITYTTVSSYFLRKGLPNRGQEFLAAASKTALEHDMDLACLGNAYSEKIDQGFSVFPNNDDDEMRATFSHLIYLGTVVHLVVKSPLVVDARLVDTFNLLTSTQAATSTHVDVNFMRAKSIRLFAETRQLTSMWNGSASSTPHWIATYYFIIVPSPPALWFDQYWKLVEQIHSHIGLLQPAALKVSFIPDYHNIGIFLKLSTILALAALADLHAIFAPSHPESSRRYRDALTETVSISSTFSSDDFQYLSPILSLCWTVATEAILENRIVYENQNSIIATIRQCNQNLKQAFVDLSDIYTMYTI